MCVSPTMNDSRCEWVQARLPLLLGEADRDQSDLSGDEQAKLDHHLEQCAECRRHQAALARAVDALAAAARQCSSAVPSLWPSLERRIREQELVASASWSGRLADRWRRITAPRRENHPLRTAWARDTLLESKTLLKRFEPESQRTFRLAVSLAAAVLFAVAVPLLAWNARPNQAEPPPQAVPTIVDRADPSIPQGSEVALEDDEAETSVLHADSPRPASHSAIASAALPRTQTNVRSVNEVEGIGVHVSDPRDAKPAY